MDCNFLGIRGQVLALALRFKEKTKCGCHMRGRFLKSLGTVFLSIILAHSSVAWALENCLNSVEREDNGSSGYSETAITAPEPVVPWPAPPVSQPITRIHCLVSQYEIGPMVQASSGSRLTPSRELLSKICLTAGSAVAGKTNSPWLNARFEWHTPLSSSGGVSRHLFLSVFRV